MRRPGHGLPMAQDADGPDWVDFVNREAEALQRLVPPMTKQALRGAVRDRLGEAFAFPLDVTLRGLVAGERHVASSTTPQGVLLAAKRYLELVPEGLTRDAAALVGPVLVPSDRALQAGSVLRARVRIEDPRARHVEVPGLHAEVEALDVEVAVEP